MLDTDVALKAIQTDSSLTLKFTGCLTVHTLSHVWDEALSHLRNAKKIAIDVSELKQCDTAGATLFDEIENMAKKQNIAFERNQNAALPLIQYVEKLEEDLDYHEENIPPSPYVLIGKFFTNKVQDIQTGISYVGKLSYHILGLLCQPHKIRWRDVFFQIETVGPNAFIIVMLVGTLFGLIMSFQSAIAMSKFGANILVANMVGISFFRELGPLITGIVLTGRSASAFAAEIGTMKVNQEIDALSTMNINPFDYIVFPRIIAAVFMMPLLTIFMLLFGMIGCGFVMAGIGYPPLVYYHQLQSALNMNMLIGCMIKSIILAVFIASIGCYYGLKTRNNPTEVGVNTTRSVVSCIIAIAIVDGIISTIFYLLEF